MLGALSATKKMSFESGGCQRPFDLRGGPTLREHCDYEKDFA